jgi:hypothetical protein
VYIRPDEDFRGELVVPVRVVSPIPNAPLHRYFTSNRYLMRIQVPGIAPDIKANGQDDALTLRKTDSVTLALALQNDGLADDADWWLAAATPLGLFFWTLSGWTDAWLPLYSGPLFHLNRFASPAIPLRSFPTGTYLFLFGVDRIMDGRVTLEDLYFDTVSIRINE